MPLHRCLHCGDGLLEDEKILISCKGTNVQKQKRLIVCFVLFVRHIVNDVNAGTFFLSFVSFISFHFVFSFLSFFQCENCLSSLIISSFKFKIQPLFVHTSTIYNYCHSFECSSGGGGDMLIDTKVHIMKISCCTYVRDKTSIQASSALHTYSFLVMLSLTFTFSLQKVRSSNITELSIECASVNLRLCATPIPPSITFTQLVTLLHLSGNYNCCKDVIIHFSGMYIHTIQTTLQNTEKLMLV